MLTPARTAAPLAAAHPERRWVDRSPVDLCVLALLVALAAVLRFATLTHQSYWFDESQAVHELRSSFGGMLSLWSTNEPNPPLYFVLAWPWAKLFGTGEAGLRSLSALAGVAVIPIAWLCGRELVSSRAGLVAAALAAVSPFLIWYSQEAREYMLLCALCGASVLLFVRALRAPSARNLGWWAVISALALATQYFAAFLVFAEALWLLYTVRSRRALLSVALTVAVECALLPHAIEHASHPAHWIGSVGPLSVRLQQLPVAFAFNTLYKGGGAILSDGLLGAALLAGVVIVLLVIAADARELRGAGIAAALAACVLLVPLGLALVGRDYVEARALMPAWIPLALVLGAACTVRRARVPGAALAAVLLAAFVWAGIRIDDHISYQRQNWAGVAAALGRASGPRAIVAYDGSYATAPLAVLLPGVAWTGSGQIPQQGAQYSTAPVTVGELDIVGNTAQRIARRFPPGMTRIGSKTVNGEYLVIRFRLARAGPTTLHAISLLAPTLLGPAAPGAPVLVQRP
jgi:mannosyltransferase